MKLSDVTIYLRDKIDSIYDADFIDSMDDLIRADNAVNQILMQSGYNADYSYLSAYAKTKQAEAYELFDSCK
jgi:hypothetical protein